MPNSKIWSLRLERQGHPFHIVNRSPWPFFISLTVLSVTTGAVLYMHRYEGGDALLFWGVFFLSAIMWFWFRDIVIEGTLEGQHTKKVQTGLRLGMKLFITTEIMFFFSFFWAFFHSALAPHTFIGAMWPPKGIIPMYLPEGLSIAETNEAFLIEQYLEATTGKIATLNEVKILEEYLKTASVGLIDKSSFLYILSDHATKFYLIDKPYWIRLSNCVNPNLEDDGFRWAFCYLPLFNPYSIPLAATFILLSSGLTLHIAGMWFNYANTSTLWPFNDTIRKVCFSLGLKMNKTKETLNTPTRSGAFYAIAFWLSATIFLGLIFTAIQAYEYVVLLPFAINDSVFGSCFYMLTGFHGFHVILGTLGLIVCLYRHIQCHFTKTVHVGFECAAWYWHFVDGVWLFVYSIIYWWSAPLKKPYLWINSENTPFSCGTRAWTWDEVINSNKLIPYSVQAESDESVTARELLDLLFNMYHEGEINPYSIGVLLVDILQHSNVSLEHFDKIDFTKIFAVLELYAVVIKDIEKIVDSVNVNQELQLTRGELAFLNMLKDEVKTYENCAQMLITYRNLIGNKWDITTSLFPADISL